eukprot:jgi/Psemu1/60677/gm1.60677_g
MNPSDSIRFNDISSISPLGLLFIPSVRFRSHRFHDLYPLFPYNTQTFEDPLRLILDFYDYIRLNSFLLKTYHPS